MTIIGTPIGKLNFEPEINERSRGYFDILLKPLNLTEEEIQKQSLEELRISLERINEAIQHPENFGTIHLKITSDAGVIIAKTTSESHFSMGILPILLERKKLILQRIRLLEGEKKIGSINEGFDLVTISRALNPWVNIFNLYSRFRTSPSSI